MAFININNVVSLKVLIEPFDTFDRHKDNIHSFYNLKRVSCFVFLTSEFTKKTYDFDIILNEKEMTYMKKEDCGINSKVRNV